MSLLYFQVGKGRSSIQTTPSSPGWAGQAQEKLPDDSLKRPLLDVKEARQAQHLQVGQSVKSLAQP